MAKATEAQVRKLEDEHKTQFYYLVQANNFILNTAKQDKSVYKNPGFVAYIKSVERLVQKWQGRQTMLEKAGIPKYHPIWFNYAAQPELNRMLAEIDKERQTKGIAFIPLLIWAIVAIVGLFTAEQIVDETHNTSQEQQELLDKTAQVCKDLKLTPEQCKQMITEQTESTDKGGGIFSGIGTFVGLGILAYVAVNSGIFSKKKQSETQTQTT